MIFEALQSELFRLKFPRLSSKILKIPELNLVIQVPITREILNRKLSRITEEETAKYQNSVDDTAPNTFSSPYRSESKGTLNSIISLGQG